MSRKYLWYIVMLALVLVAGCAKKNTAYQDADALTLLAVVPVVGNPQQLDCDDTYMYVALDQGGLGLIDLQNYKLRWYSGMGYQTPGETPEHLHQTRKLALSPEYNRLFLYEITGSDNIWIIDTTNPDSLSIIANAIGSTTNLQDLVVRSIPNPTTDNVMELAYCSGNNITYKTHANGFWLGTGVDILNQPWRFSGVEIDDNYVYGAAQQNGLVIYKKDSTLVSHLPLYGSAQKLVVRDGYAYVACRQGGLQVVDVRDPYHPVRVSGFVSTGYANEVDYHNGAVALSSGGGGAYVFDARNPAKLELIQRVTEVGYCNAVKFKGDKLAIGSRDDGVFFYKVNR